MATLKWASTLGTGYQRTTISNGGSGYTSGATSIIVADGSVFESTAGDFYVGVGDQDPPDFIKKVTSRTGNTLTVPAGVVAGTDGNKADGVTVQWVLPPEGLDQLQSERNRVMTVSAFDSLASTEYRNGDRIVLSDSIYEVVRDSGAWTYLYKGQSVVRPPSAGWTADNGTTAPTLDSTHGYEYLYQASASAVAINVRYRAAPATPYVVKALIKADFTGTLLKSGNADAGGILVGFRSAAGKIVAWRPNGGASGTIQISTDKWTSTAAFSAVYASWGPFGNVNAYFGSPIWIAFGDDGANVTFWTSLNGQNWHQWDQRARTDFMASVDSICWGLYPNSSGVAAALIDWSVVASATP